MPQNFISTLLYGPQGPILKKMDDNKWGPYLEEAFEGKDDENFVEKTRIIGKYSFMYATMLAICDINLINNRGGLPTALQRMKFHYVPWLGGTVAYTATVSTVCGLRGGKTDQWNHTAGGLMIGCIIGKMSRSFILGMVGGGFVGALAWFYKDSRINGYDMFTAIWEKPGQCGHALSHKCDFTTNWNAPRKGYWARTPEEAAEVFKSGQYGDHAVKRIW